ncbi:Alpha/Beta hydrolase protein [Chytriomyces sp. MP71]|nr:Alpha/Beta hydrolase protein [Chytriomyces sp. MP71]
MLMHNTPHMNMNTSASLVIALALNNIIHGVAAASAPVKLAPSVPVFPPAAYSFPVTSCKPPSEIPPLTIQVSTGYYSGVNHTTYFEWRGVPYAAPPTDYTTSAAPPIPSCALHNATASIACVQSNGQGQTDCLVLNVAVPPSANSTSKLPVFFWVHEGSFQTGSGLAHFYAQYAAAWGLVAVSTNYRLKGCTVGECMTDVTMALQWVHNNIALFGGDPSRVTVVGLSAGSGLLATLLWQPSPAAAYFHRAAFYSGYIAEYQIDLQRPLYLVPSLFVIATDVNAPVASHEVAVSKLLQAAGLSSYHVKNMLGGDGSDLGTLFSTAKNLYQQALADFVWARPNLFLAPFASKNYTTWSKAGVFMNVTIPTTYL